MFFFVWYDDSSKKLAADKLQEAIVAYVERFKIPPALVLVNSVDMVELAGIVVRCERTVQPNNFWLGYEGVVDLPIA